MTQGASSGIDLTACEAEPIHLLGAVQEFGFLLAAMPDGTVCYASANAAAMLGRPIGQVLGAHLDVLLLPEALHSIRSRLQLNADSGEVERIFSMALLDVDARYDVAVHTLPGNATAAKLTIIEAEPSRTEPQFDPVATVKGMMTRLLRAEDTQSLHDRAARQLRAVLGFDRVMVYRFAEDGTGEVVGESHASDLHPYRGLRYPASDIPRQARALYTRNWLRLIADVAQPPVRLVAAGGQAAPLDLSSSVLRAVSPVHVEYLRNMGVAASLSISVLRGEQLWGLLACHHREPLLPSYQRRSAAELFGQLYSLQVESRERAETARYEQEARAAHDRIMLKVSEDDSIGIGLGHAADELRRLVPCDGAVLVAEGVTSVGGEVPAPEVLQRLIQRLNASTTSRVLAFDRLSDLLSAEELEGTPLAGMLAIPISRMPQDYVLFFRRELVRNVTWAGDPNRPAEQLKEGIGPRRSFTAWKEVVRGSSAPWTAAERMAAESLRVTLLEVLVRMSGAADRQRRMAGERQQLLIAELNHRVRNILGLIRALVSRSKESAETLESFVSLLNGRIQSLARAHDQLTDDHWGPVSLRGMIEGEFHAYLGDSRQRASIGGPAVLVQPQALTVVALVVHELATNAAKYGALSDRHGHVSCNWQLDAAGNLVLAWRESGGPEVRPPNRRGFGTTVIERSIPFELQGEAILRYPASGVQADFVIPARFISQGDDSAPMPVPSLRPHQVADAKGVALLIEDSTLLAMDAEEMLLALGFHRVEVAGSVAAARAILQRAGETLDFALLDVNLGDETSLPIAEELLGRGIPFAFATGYGARLELPPAIAKVAHIIVKPYRQEDIADLVGRTLGN